MATNFATNTGRWDNACETEDDSSRIRPYGSLLHRDIRPGSRRLKKVTTERGRPGKGRPNPDIKASVTTVLTNNSKCGI